LLNSLVFIIITNYFVNDYYLQKEAKGAKKKPVTNVSTLHIITKLVTLFKARCADQQCCACTATSIQVISCFILEHYHNYWLQRWSLPELYTNTYMYIQCILCSFASKVLCTQALVCSSAVLSIAACAPATYTYTCPCRLLKCIISGESMYSSTVLTWRCSSIRVPVNFHVNVLFSTQDLQCWSWEQDQYYTAIVYFFPLFVGGSETR